MNRIKCRLICILAPLLVLSGCKSSGTEAPAPVNVEVQKARPADDRQDLAYSGTMEESESIPHNFPIVGTVSRVLVSEGTPVRKGQLLAELDNTNPRNAYDMAQAALAQAEDAYNRLTPMHDKGSLPDVKYVEVETGLKQAQAAAAIAKKSLEDCRLIATVDGFVGKCSLDPGTIAMPNIASITIVKIAKVFASVAIPENEIARIGRGQAAEIRIGALGTGKYPGTVEEIGVMADVLTHSYKIKIAIPNPDNAIRPGMVCTAVLRFPGEARGLVIPNQSLLVDETGRDFVYCVDAAQGKAVQKYVKTGKLMNGGIEILEGLTADDLIVMAGQHKLADQSSVKIVNR
jgi:membrane fusion protein, multidrug efflux system